MNDLIIFGSGGLAREVLMVARDINKIHPTWNILGFIDENQDVHGKIICDVPVLGGIEWIERNISERLFAVIGIGNPKFRKKLDKTLSSLGLKFATLIHPTVVKSEYITIGEGTIITANNILTTQIKLGRHVFLNLACTVGHDTIIEDYVNCAPGCNISGNVVLETGCWIGTGVKIIQNIRIGKWTRVGAGAVVINDLPSKTVAVGVPAKVIRNRGADEVED